MNAGVETSPAWSFRLHVLAAIVVMLGGIWASSGTMAPYATTLDSPVPYPPCGYLMNIDHAHFEGTWLFLIDYSRDAWESSVVLRRMLFPLLAYPLMKQLGFIAGGIFTSAILQVIALLALAMHLRRTAGNRGAVVATWLLATSPGVTYWAGLPYSYAIIVPGTVFCLILLSVVERAPSAIKSVAACLGIGILATGYDFLPMFGVAALLILAMRRRFAWLPAAAVCLIVPTLVVLLWIKAHGVAPSNANLDIYGNIMRAWLHPDRLREWLDLIGSVPTTALVTFLYANFIFLPVLFLVCVSLNALQKKASFTMADLAIWGAALAAFLFVNAAPPSEGVQIRGTGFPRLYQPLFAAMLPFIARYVQNTGRAVWASAAAALLGASVCYGAILHNPITGPIYIRFYRHAAAGSYERNLAKYGRHPFGDCKRG